MGGYNEVYTRKKKRRHRQFYKDAFFLMSVINAIERRDKVIKDIKRSYLNATMKDEVFMKVTGKEVDLFCEIDPSLA